MTAKDPEQDTGVWEFYDAYPVLCHEHDQPTWHHMHYYTDGRDMYSGYGPGDSAEREGSCEEFEPINPQERKRSFHDYYDYVAGVGEDPLGLIANVNAKRPEWWVVSYRRTIPGVGVVAARVGVSPEPRVKFNEIPAAVAFYALIKASPTTGKAILDTDEEVYDIDTLHALCLDEHDAENMLQILDYRNGYLLDVMFRIELPPLPMSPEQLAAAATLEMEKLNQCT